METTTNNEIIAATKEETPMESLTKKKYVPTPLSKRARALYEKKRRAANRNPVESKVTKKIILFLLDLLDNTRETAHNKIQACKELLNYYKGRQDLSIKRAQLRQDKKNSIQLKPQENKITLNFTDNPWFKEDNITRETKEDNISN